MNKLDHELGIYVYGLAAVAYGATDLIWREFDPSDQPLQAWGDHIPGAKLLACIAGVWLMVTGGALLWRASRRWAAALLTSLYAMFVLFPLPRFYTAPHYQGHRAYVYIGVLGMVCQQILLLLAAVVVWKSLSGPDTLSRSAAAVVRWIFGLCAVDFGLAHLTAIWTVIPLIPKWMPMGPTFWAVLTGIAFIAAGVAIVVRVLDVLAAEMLGLMLLVFSALALAPLLVSSPRDHASWGSNAYNLMAVGAAWTLAEWLASRKPPLHREL